MGKKKKTWTSFVKNDDHQQDGHDQQDDHGRQGEHDEQLSHSLSNMALDFSTIVNVAVGRDEAYEVFKVHAHALLQTSDFFKAALKPEWDASRVKAKTVTLPDADPATFRLYMHWSYRRTLPGSSQNMSETNDVHFQELAVCYALGEVLMDIPFKNTVIEHLINSISRPDVSWYYRNGGVKPNEVAEFAAASHIIYENTPKSSPVRRLLVRMWKEYRVFKESQDVVEDLHKDFLVDLVRKYIGTGQDDHSSPIQAKDYLEHEVCV